jgi:hypothetical protein
MSKNITILKVFFYFMFIYFNKDQDGQWTFSV